MRTTTHAVRARTCRRSPTGPGRIEEASDLRILTLNCGSSTLKFDVLDVPGLDEGVTRVASGSVERIGSAGRASLNLAGEAGSNERSREVRTRDHNDAFREARDLLQEAGLLAAVEAAGHRVVHGGLQFRNSTRLTDEVIDAIREVSDLAPLHNHPALAVIEAAREALGEAIPAVAAFDTAFFADLPEEAWRYAIPRELTEQYGIRRFGFHGLAHGDMVQRFLDRRPEVLRPRLITLMLGSGCSVAASFDGRPVDTSMGYTPLEGLIMGTRSGDIDPALPLRLQSLAGLAAGEVEAMLNARSGLLGLSGRSSEMRDLVAAAEKDPDAASAVEAFCRSARKYVGAYMALLGGADAIVFGGGVGENIPGVRRNICRGFEWAGLVVDDAANENAAGAEARISGADSRIEAWVVRVDEAAVIARETAALLAAGKE